MTISVEPTPSFKTMQIIVRQMAATSAPMAQGRASCMITIIASGAGISLALKAISAICGLNIKPGLTTEPQVPMKTAAAAITGRTFRAIKAGISRTPTAAAIPAAEGSTMFSSQVMMTAPGMTMTGTRANGLTKRFTKWSEHFVKVMT